LAQARQGVGTELVPCTTLAPSPKTKATGMMIPAPVLALAVFASIAASAPVDKNANAGVVKPHKIVAIQVAKPSATEEGVEAAEAAIQVAKPSSHQQDVEAAVAKNKGKGEDSQGRHFLDKHDLESISSVRCLEEKQRNPERPCSELGSHKTTFSEDATFNMGHFPHWKDHVCHSNQEFFCDASNQLKPDQQTETQQRLQLMKERTLVNCGEFSKKQDPDTAHWYDKVNGAQNPFHHGRLGLEDFRPFNLGVVVSDEIPANERDPKSMEYFGRLLMTKWGLTPIYNGVDNGNGVNQIDTWGEYTRNCPNTAVLFISPKTREVTLTSPSCEFICPARGGPEVIAAALYGLDHGGTQEAIMRGIDAVNRVLKVSLPLSIQKASVPTLHPGLAKSDAAWVWTMRLGLIFVIGFALMSVVAFVYYVLLPQKDVPFHRTSFRAMNGAGGRREIQEAYQNQAA